MVEFCFSSDLNNYNQTLFDQKKIIQTTQNVLFRKQRLITLSLETKWKLFQILRCRNKRQQYKPLPFKIQTNRFIAQYNIHTLVSFMSGLQKYRIILC